MTKNIAYYIFSFFIILLMSLTSCDTFDPKAEVPAYIQTDSVIFVTNTEQGSNYQKIKDVWFNLDGSQVGAFEIPAKFPVIAKGRRPISVKAGILKSGIHDFREVYPFFEIIKDTFDFVGAEVINYIPTFTYKPEAKFWIEDFEDPGFKLHTTDTINYLKQITDPRDPNNQIGHVHLPANIEAFRVFTKKEIKLYASPIYMEIEYKCDETFGIGVLTNRASGSTESIRAFTLIKPSDNWNKLYLNLAEQFALNSGAVSYDVYFFFASDVGQTANIYIDNIKIVSS